MEVRYNDAIVIRDPKTQQPVLRGATHSFSDCPTCHRPFRPPSPERQTSPHRSPIRESPFISPEYFRMLHAANTSNGEPQPPSSPIRRLVEPAVSSPANITGGSVPEAEFVTSTPAPSTGPSIKKEALSPNYFQRFFSEEKELGRGGKGVVLLVRHELDGVDLGKFACKRVPVGNDHAWLEKVLIEVQLLQGLSHPNLVSYRHVWLQDVQLNRFGPSVPCAFILQQYCNSGDLLHYIVGPIRTIPSTNEELKQQMRRRSRGGGEHPDWSGVRSHQRKLAFEEIYSFFKDITSGLAHLHASNYIHRDLKPSNCLLHQDGNEMRCLISDFGEVQSENSVRKSTGSTGTISYCAPEVLRKDESGRYGNFTTKSDIFSLGMILYFMCFGRLPYKSADSIQEENEDIDLLRAEISTWTGFQGERRERPDLPNQLYSFLKRLLAIDPSGRPSANDILDAIQTEKGLENPPRKRTGSSMGRVGRIHSIDSPMPPSTPVNEPTKRAFPDAYIEDASPDSPPLSPPTQAQLATEKDHTRSRSRKNSSQSPTGNVITPLLMPPPSTAMADFKHKLALYRHHVVSWITLNQQTLYLILRLLVFLAKILSLTKPCSPALPREVIWWPMIVLAACELSIGSRIGWWGMGLLALIHTLVLFGVASFGRGLCGGQLFEKWEYDTK
ncbi:kinase-like domain-containing protein [Amylocarpus encephaloides]|uniref:non-specific serine/threonine protein kinase n=1 Tax=Amylocarpus encephaloides TaxID=45428 RepID=A0A9P7YKN8_9HELO|nr:kinase-like domain-containing protein [Amylocarpus encephaloides]